MDLYSRNKFLVRVIIILVALNIGSVGYLWWQLSFCNEEQTNQRDIKKVAAILKNELQLNDNQEKQLKAIREDFFAKEAILSTQIKQQRDSMNTEMFNEKTDSLLVTRLARRVAENEYLMETYRIKQAIQLKKMLNADQLKRLQHLVKDIRDYFQPEKKNKDR